MQPAFIVIEGIDGSGKTTLLCNILQVLKEEGVKVTSFKEPGDDNPIGRAFREMSKKRTLPSLTSAYLLAAERFWRSEQVSCWLQEGYLVLADRYYLSGMVYCAAEELPFGRFSAIHEGIVKPDLYVFLDISFDLACKRKGEARDRWERAALLRKAASLYPEACSHIRKTESAQICIVDASQPISSVLREALVCISQVVAL